VAIARLRLLAPAVRGGHLARSLALPLALLLFMYIGLRAAHAQGLWQEEEQRLRVGVAVFPAVLGAVESLTDKRSSDGGLDVVVVHDGASGSARVAVENLNKIGEVRDLPLAVKVLTPDALDAYSGAAPAGIFVASKGSGSKRLRQWSERFGALVFSPFVGDVEAGAVAGISVSDQILPYVNRGQAQRARIRFKPFFLGVARQYE
jgi:hypothetical protein